MDEVATYRTIIEQVLQDYAQTPYAYCDIASHVVVDSLNDQYLLVNVGWDEGRRIHGCLIHLDIIAGKVWIQRDGTEEGIATALVAAGIPKERIVLGTRKELSIPECWWLDVNAPFFQAGQAFDLCFDQFHGVFGQLHACFIHCSNEFADGMDATPGHCGGILYNSLNTVED